MKADLWEIRLNRIRECADAGMTRAEAAETLAITYATISRHASKYGITFKRSGTGPANADRAESMAAMYRAGKTLEEVGSIFGITRERVRQIISKYHGMSAEDGGQALMAKIMRERRRSEREARCLSKNGCTFKQLQELRRYARKMLAEGVGPYQTPIKAFGTQRNNAKRRGIEWNLKLWEWWSIWKDSGRWSDRGRGHGYMMCRFGDEGPYEVGNVYIATGTHNASIQPNNPYRSAHPDHNEAMTARRARGGHGAGRKCSIDGCDRKHYATDLCRCHYATKWQRQKRASFSEERASA